MIKRRNQSYSALEKQKGYYVILENEVKWKITLTYNAKPYKFMSKKGFMVTAKWGERKVTRDSLWFKPVSFDVPKDPTKEEDDDDNKINLTLNWSPTFNKPIDPMEEKY